MLHMTAGTWEQPGGESLKWMPVASSRLAFDHQPVPTLSVDGKCIAIRTLPT